MIRDQYVLEFFFLDNKSFFVLYRALKVKEVKRGKQVPLVLLVHLAPKAPQVMMAPKAAL